MNNLRKVFEAISALLLLFALGCATAVKHTPLPGVQVHHGFLDRMGGGASAQLTSDTISAMNQFQWPLHSMQVTSGFGHRGSAYHEGIDLRARQGTPVYAVQGGTVVYANRTIRSYGNMIVLRHKGEVSTVYAHNSEILVRRGQAVQQGQIIARTGNTGRSRGPHLHFEIRSGLGALDPIQYIPHSIVMARPLAQSGAHLKHSGKIHTKFHSRLVAVADRR